MSAVEYCAIDLQGDGPCRWCGIHEYDVATLRQGERTWFECGWCCAAINDYDLYSDDADGYDAGEIRRRSAQLREAT